MDNKQSDTNKFSQDLMDILLDKDNRDPIVLIDEQGRRLNFEQVAVIPYPTHGDKKLYVILKPIDELAGVAPDEAIVFAVEDNGYGNSFLKAESDEEIAVGVFNEYYKLLEEVD